MTIYVEDDEENCPNCGGFLERDTRIKCNNCGLKYRPKEEKGIRRDPYSADKVDRDGNVIESRQVKSGFW